MKYFLHDAEIIQHEKIVNFMYRKSSFIIHDVIIISCSSYAAGVIYGEFRIYAGGIIIFVNYQILIRVIVPVRKFF